MHRVVMMRIDEYSYTCAQTHARHVHVHTCTHTHTHTAHTHTHTHTLTHTHTRARTCTHPNRSRQPALFCVFERSPRLSNTRGPDAVEAVQQREVDRRDPKLLEVTSDLYFRNRVSERVVHTYGDVLIQQNDWVCLHEYAFISPLTCDQGPILCVPHALYGKCCDRVQLCTASHHVCTRFR
jgi:hypothetical protein